MENINEDELKWTVLSIAEPLSLLKKEEMLSSEPMVDVTRFVNFMQHFFFE